MGKLTRRSPKKRGKEGKNRKKSNDRRSKYAKGEEEKKSAVKSLVPKRLAPLDHIKNLYDGANANPGDRERKICHKKDLMEVVRQIHQSEKQSIGITQAPYIKRGAANVASSNQRSASSGSADNGAAGLPELPIHSNGVVGGSDTKPAMKSARSILQENLHENARRYNELKQVAEERTVQLDAMIDELMEVEMENESLRKIEKHQTADTRRIDELKRQIKKLKLSLGEKRRKRDQYEHMRRRLCTNQVAFDAHIKGMEDALQASTREFDEVKLLMHQLEIGNATAQEELKLTMEQIAKEEELRNKQMAVRRQEAANARRMEEWRKEREKQRLEMEAKLRGDLDQEGERKLLETLNATEGKEERLERLRIRATQKVNSYEEAFAQIREATGVRTLDEMVEKYLGQGANRAALLDERAEADSRQKQVREQLAAVKKEFSELKAAGIGGSELNREMYDKLDDEILRYRHELKVQQSVSNRLDNVLIKIQAGMNGLQQRLTPFDHILEQGGGEVVLPKTGIQALDSILLCEMKLCKLLDHINVTLAASGVMPQLERRFTRQGIQENDVASVAGSVKEDVGGSFNTGQANVEGGLMGTANGTGAQFGMPTPGVLQDVIGKAAMVPFTVEAPKLHENNIRVKPRTRVAAFRRLMPSNTKVQGPISDSDDSDFLSDSDSDPSEDERNQKEEEDPMDFLRMQGERSALLKKKSKPRKYEVHDAATLKKMSQTRYVKALERKKNQEKRQKAVEEMKHKRRKSKQRSGRASKSGSGAFAKVE